MKTIESIISNDLRPWLDKNNQADNFYTPEIRNTPAVAEKYKTNYTLDFSITAFSDKIRYYRRMIDNDVTQFLNTTIEELENKTENLILFKLKTNRSKLNSLLINTNELIIRKGYELNLIISRHAEFNIDRQHKESTYILNYTLVSLIKCYLELQSYYSNYINPDDMMNVADIYSRLLNKPQPENSFIKETQIINVLPLPDKDSKPKTEILSFKYKKIHSNSGNITDLMDSLKKNSFIVQDTSITDFRHLFSGEFVAKPIKWTGGKSTLSYFIKLINNQLKVVTYPKNSLWKVVCACFVDENEKPLDESNLKDQKKPKVKLSEIEKAANLLK